MVLDIIGNKQRDKQTNRQKDRQTHKQTDRKKNKNKKQKLDILQYCYALLKTACYTNIIH